jgi:hypothetical protein
MLNSCIRQQSPICGTATKISSGFIGNCGMLLALITFDVETQAYGQQLPSS